jgi:dTDP-4-dehydrorhamnose 3,5-epimerase
MKRRVLITGASGFVGGAILESLAEEGGFELSALARDAGKAKEIERLGARVYIGDVTKPVTLAEAIADKDAVIHCAAIMSGYGSAPRRRFYETNVLGTDNLLKACSGGRLKQFIHISTVGVYGKGRGEPLGEKAPYGNELSDYEWSKKEAELVVLRRARERHIPSTILRPSQLYGAGMYYGWPETIKAIKEGVFLIPRGSGTIHLLDIKDLVKAVSLALFNETAMDKTYNIAGPQIYPVGAVFDLIADIIGVKRPGRVPYMPLYMTAVLLGFIPRLFRKGRVALFTPHRLKFFIANHVYDISRARSELNYSPRVTMEEALKAMISWCEEKGLI